MKRVSHLRNDAIALYHALNELIRVYQFRDRDRISCHDISITQCHALEGLVQQGPLMLNDLANYLRLDKSTTSRVVESLKRKGYVTRLVHPDDSRARELKATAAGVRLRGRIMNEILKEEEDLLSGLSVDIRRVLPGILKTLATSAANRGKASKRECAATSSKSNPVRRTRK